MDNKEMEDQYSREEIIKKIMESLGPNGVASRTVIVGESGIGKTWLAKEVIKRVTQESSSSYNILWLHLNKKIGVEKSLYENLASQLSLFSEHEEGEEHSDSDDSLDSLKKKVTEEIIKNKKKNLLLVLDDEGSMTTEKHVMKDLELGLFLEEHSTIKRLVTRRDETEDKETTTIKVPPLTEPESRVLLRNSEHLLESLNIEDYPVLLKTLYDNGEIKEPNLVSCIASKSKGLPSAIIVLTKTLQSIKTLSTKQRKIFKELILSSELLNNAATSKKAIDRKRYNPVLRLTYELLKPEETEKSPVIACFWHVMDFYKYSGCGYYRDLIAHWMLEGYFDPVKSVEKAYKQGHSIFMEFMNRGILKIQENNIVVPEMSMSNLLDLQDCGFFGRSSLGFNRVYVGERAKGLGRIILIDDTIQTIPSKEKKIKTIIVSGNRLRREAPNKFFEKQEMQDLEVVVLFEPTFQDLVKSLSTLKKLRVLVIRDCDLIRNIDELKDLKGLQVLEVSGASYLDNISDDFFKNMTHLQSLNLSGTSIVTPPSTIENLSMLRCFVFRDCPNLQDLPNFCVSTKNLEVIDIRGARELKSYFDRVKNWKDYKGKNKNFAHLQKLEHLDFSETQIIRLPIFHVKNSDYHFETMPCLTRLLIKNCTELKRLPQLKPLSNLKVLDASGATRLVEMLEVCLEDKKELRILDISETNLPELADTINDVINLNQLLIRNCSMIKELPSIEKLTSLEVFDISGCNLLEKIDGSFENMSYLKKVNLSGTSLDKLPNKLSKLSNIKELIIRNCFNLKAIPSLEKVIHLEIFDVSGCNLLEKIEGSFEGMFYLREVNLSGTKLETVPEFPKQSILCFSKRIVLADSRCLDVDDWSQVKVYLEMNQERSSIPEKTHEEKSEKLVHQGFRYQVLDHQVFPDVDIVVKENESESVSSIINDFETRSIKSCWVERCKKMDVIFTRLEKQDKDISSLLLSLETLWISNLPLLKKLYTTSNGGFDFKNLKKLTLDCCPRIESLFHGEASMLPYNLEILRVMFCDNLKSLFEGEVGGELSTLRKLYLLDLPVLTSNGVKFPSLEIYTKEKCPNFEATIDELRVGARNVEEISEDQPH